MDDGDRQGRTHQLQKAYLERLRYLCDVCALSSIESSKSCLHGSFEGRAHFDRGGELEHARCTPVLEPVCRKLVRGEKEGKLRESVERAKACLELR